MRHVKKISLLTMTFLLIGSSLMPMASAESIKVSEATVELTSGLLTLDSVSSFHFGTHEIVDTMKYESTTLNPIIQVSDRRGTGAGWTVTAKVSNFKNEDHTESLQGATLTLTNGEVFSTGQSAAPKPASLIELHTGGVAATVVTAHENTGLGTWMVQWLPTRDGHSNQNVTLDIPTGSATIGHHKATITWTLTDAPGS